MTQGAPIGVDSPEAITALRALVRDLAAVEDCDDNPNVCGLDSGPYCSAHGQGEQRELVLRARALLSAEQSEAAPE